MQICICRVNVEYVKLKAICMPKQWKTIASSMLKDSGYPVYGANGIIGYYSEYNHDKETILVTCRGATCGSVNICEPFSYINGNAMALDDLDGKIDIKYLYYYLKKRGFDDVISGSAQPQITRTSIEKIEIPICEISKQKMIVNLFDKIELLINNQKRQLQLLDELVKARFVEMFGEIEDCDKWESKIWNEVVTIKNGRDYKKVLVSDGGYPVVGTGGEIARASKYLCPENTIVVGRKGSINNPMLMKEKFWNVDTAFGVIPNSDYLHYQYFYCFCKFYNFMKLNKATTLPSTTKADLLKIRINIPPLELQNQFASFVQEIDKSRLLSNHSLFLIKSIIF